MSVKRYTCAIKIVTGEEFAVMKESDDGDCVDYEDYAALEQRNKELEDKLLNWEQGFLKIRVALGLGLHSHDGLEDAARELKSTVERYEKAINVLLEAIHGYKRELLPVDKYSMQPCDAEKFAREALKARTK